MTKTELRVIYDERERIDPLWYVLVILALLEVFAILAILLLAFLSSNSISPLLYFGLLAITNLFNTVIGAVIGALIRKKEKPKEFSKGPTVLTTPVTQDRLPPAESLPFQLPTSERSRAEIPSTPIEPNLQLPSAEESNES